VGMTVEDTMHTGDGSAHCDVPSTLARNIYNGSVANDVCPPSSPARLNPASSIKMNSCGIA
ncbi:uncharacterized protein LOC124044275, partial [Tachysurus ichikawai]